VYLTCSLYLVNDIYCCCLNVVMWNMKMKACNVLCFYVQLHTFMKNDTLNVSY